VYDLTDSSYLPQPIHALVAIIPLTPSWAALRQKEDNAMPLTYPDKGPAQEVIWFKQTIRDACGSIALIHSCLNGTASKYLIPDSPLALIRRQAIPLGMVERARVLEDSSELEYAHEEAAKLGDTVAPNLAAAEKLGQHCVAFLVKDGRLWELEGSRRGPLDRGLLEEGEGVLGAEAVKRGLGRYIELEGVHGDPRFSVVALCGRE